VFVYVSYVGSHFHYMEIRILPDALWLSPC
jgi:hypothetical protein